MSDSLPIKSTLHRLQDLMQLRQQVDTLASGLNWHPPVDWVENETHLALVVDLPGVDPETLSVTEDEGGLVLAGEKEKIALDMGGHFLQAERPGGSFSRRFEFPVEVCEHSSQARLRNGVLTITWEKPKRVIESEE